MNCTGCKDTIGSECIPWNGSSISCLNLSADPTIQDVVYALGVKVCNLTSSTNSSAWLLNGNNVTSEKFFGTTSNFRIPIRVNNDVKWSYETNGDIKRNEVLYSIYSTEDDADLRFGNTSWGFHCLENIIDNGVVNSCFGMFAGQNITTGNGNVLMGEGAGRYITTGYSNVILGTEAGQGITTGNNNIIIGGTSGGNLSYTTAIGASGGAGYNYSIAIGGASTSASNQLAIGFDGANPLLDIWFGGTGSYSVGSNHLTLRIAPSGGTNTNGSDFNIQTGAGSGTGNSGSFRARTSVPTTTGSTTQVHTDRIVALGKYTTLTESSATTFAQITLSSNTVSGGTVTVSIEANDGTNYQCRTMKATFSVVNKAGTLTMSLGTPDEVVATSSGTLTCTLTLVDAGSGVMQFKANAVSSLTQTVLRCNATITKNFGNGVIQEV